MTLGREREVDDAKEVAPFGFMWALALLIRLPWSALELRTLSRLSFFEKHTYLHWQNDLTVGVYRRK